MHLLLLPLFWSEPSYFPIIFIFYIFCCLCCSLQLKDGPFLDISIGWISILMQMMWRLVSSSWILHVNCNKRRVASIAALLSSVLHRSVFTDEGMHLTNNRPGPLKWVCVSFMCLYTTTIYTFNCLNMVAMLSIN